LFQIKFKKIDYEIKSIHSKPKEPLLSHENEYEKRIVTNLSMEESKPSSADFNSDEYINKAILFGYVMVSLI
jgi:hypothetical protein